MVCGNADLAARCLGEQWANAAHTRVVGVGDVYAAVGAHGAAGGKRQVSGGGGAGVAGETVCAHPGDGRYNAIGVDPSDAVAVEFGDVQAVIRGH